VKVHVTDLTQNILVHPARALNYRFMIAEWLWIAAHRNDVATLARYNKKMAEFSDDGVTLAGAYGPRMADQVDYLLEQLKKPVSRQAVATIWRPCPAPSKDIPCTVAWQLLAREGKLHGIVTMRSSDVWLGLPYDFHAFTQLNSGVAGEMNLEPGGLTFNLGSSHLYDQDREKALTVLSRPDELRCVRSPRLPGRPPADAILDWSDDLVHPWSVYRDVLKATTSLEALNRLENLDAATTKP